VSKNKVKLSNVVFWLVLVGASGGAFAAGFWYTYGATVNVSTKAPGEQPNLAAKAVITPAPDPTPGAGGSPASQASPSEAPGPLPVASAAGLTDGQSGQVVQTSATPTPMAPERTFEPIDPTPSPAQHPFSRPTAAPVSQQGGSEIYRVQVGPFDSRETAQKQVDELQTAGINAVVVYDGGRYQAQLGAFVDRAKAIAVADEVNTRGYSVTIRH
jgi:cell division protein FtsN